MGQSYEFEVKAQPDGDLTVHFGSAILQPSPSSVSLTRGSPGRRVISIRPSHVGFHQMAVTLRGSAKDLYDKPKPLLGVVKPSSTSAYFEKRGLKKGILEPGCCTAKGVELKCPQSSHKVTVSSTCHWSTFFGMATTSGITFASSQGLNLPFSISGARFKQTSSGYTPLPVDVTQKGQCFPCAQVSSSKCNTYGDPGKCYCLAPSDVDKVDFLSSEALPTTFLENTMSLLPQWLRFKPTPSQRTYSEDSSTTLLLVSKESLTDFKGCPGLLTRYITDGVYNVLYYSGQLDIKVDNISQIYQPQQSDSIPFCFTVNLCEGPSAAMHISIPKSAANTLQNLPIFGHFRSRGWKIDFDGMSAQNTPFSSNSPNNLAIKGSLETVYQVDQVQMNFLFKGDAGMKLSMNEQVS